VQAQRSGGNTKVLIIGNNVAGTTLAKSVRDADQAAEIEMFTEEAYHYYPRPKLIDLLTGTVDEKAMPFYPEDWYAKNRLVVHLGTRVEKVDLAGKRVLAGGAWHPYDKLVLATGSSSFVPPLKGLPKGGVFTLRTLDDAKRIRAATAGSRHAIIIGGGLLGLETARALTASNPGLRTTVLEYAEHLLMRQLDHQGAALLQKWLEGLGAAVLTKAETDEVLGSDTVTGVRLKDGRTIEGDLVVISAGTRPNLALAKDAGLKVNRGLVVDPSMTTSDPDVSGVGDVIELDGKTWGIIPPALEQARIAAKRILGMDAPTYKGTVPSNTLKVAGLDLSSMGTVRGEHEGPAAGFEEIRTLSEDGRVYRKFVVKDGKLIGAILLGTKKDWPRITKLISEGRPVDAFKANLSDPSFQIP
jgi:nitrite reductase (NADH) large subunit